MSLPELSQALICHTGNFNQFPKQRRLKSSLCQPGLSSCCSAPTAGCSETLQLGWDALHQPSERHLILWKQGKVCWFPEPSVSSHLCEFHCTSHRWLMWSQHPWEGRWSLWWMPRVKRLRTKIKYCGNSNKIAQGTAHLDCVFPKVRGSLLGSYITQGWCLARLPWN